MLVVALVDVLPDVPVVELVDVLVGVGVTVAGPMVKATRTPVACAASRRVGIAHAMDKTLVWVVSVRLVIEKAS